MNCFSFLPSTCVAMIDLMSEQLINTEYQRFKDVLSVLSVSTPSKTTNKTTTRSDRKREVLKTVLLQIISQEHIGTKTQLEEIQSMLNDIKKYHSTTPTKLRKSQLIPEKLMSKMYQHQHQTCHQKTKTHQHQ